MPQTVETFLYIELLILRKPHLNLEITSHKVTARIQHQINTSIYALICQYQNFNYEKTNPKNVCGLEKYLSYRILSCCKSDSQPLQPYAHVPTVVRFPLANRNLSISSLFHPISPTKAIIRREPHIYSNSRSYNRWSLTIAALRLVIATQIDAQVHLLYISLNVVAHPPWAFISGTTAGRARSRAPCSLTLDPDPFLSQSLIVVPLPQLSIAILQWRRLDNQAAPVVTAIPTKPQSLLFVMKFLPRSANFPLFHSFIYLWTNSLGLVGDRL